VIGAMDTQEQEAYVVDCLKRAGSEVEISAGRVIVELGQPGLGVFVIQHGTVEVFAPEGTRELGPGAVFGGRALRDAYGVRTARCVAKTDVRLVAVDRQTVEALRDDDPDFAAALPLD
jgi:CRP-like cAMP-binding protein